MITYTFRSANTHVRSIEFDRLPPALSTMRCGSKSEASYGFGAETPCTAVKTAYHVSDCPMAMQRYGTVMTNTYPRFEFLPVRRGVRPRSTGRSSAIPRHDLSEIGPSRT